MLAMPRSLPLLRGRIRPAAVATILSAFFDARDAEPCGLVLGRVERQALTIEEALATANVHPRPDAAFQVAPADLARETRSARARGLDVVGAWHGHLVGPPLPGRADEEGLLAHESVAEAPRALLVVARGAGSAPVVRAYASREGRIREIRLGR